MQINEQKEAERNREKDEHANKSKRGRGDKQINSRVNLKGKETAIMRREGDGEGG